jgi:hypothetical protein
MQNSSKTLLKEKGRKSKWQYHNRKSGGILPGDTETLISLFKDQLIYKRKAG